MPTKSKPFHRLLRRVYRKHRTRFPTARAFAHALSMDETHVSRAMSPKGLPFDVRGCLRLAAITGEDASTILRAAGKGDIATLIEDLYGAPRASIEQQRLNAAMNQLIPEVQQAVVVMVETMAMGRFYLDQLQAIPRAERPTENGPPVEPDAPTGVARSGR